MKVLFFVEPVVYRSDPRLLATWVDIINDAVRGSDGLIEAHLATSETLLGLTDVTAIKGWPLPSLELLECFGFDRVAYMRDLCSTNADTNDALLRRLSLIKEAVDPDVVISWTENAYLRQVFESSELLFTEMGPIPRTGFVQSIHLDPCGHQIGSVFDDFASPRWDEPKDDAAVTSWYDHWLRQLEASAVNTGLRDWVDTLPASKSLKLVALQPSDWLTYEGAGAASDSIGLLAAAACAAEPDDLIIPQWHPTQLPPNDELLTLLRREYPAVVVPPPSLRVGLSETFLPHVDEVITVSSNVALAAALLGRRVSVVGRSKFKALSTCANDAPMRRSDLIPVLTSKMCRPISSWTRSRRGLVEHIEVANDWRDSLHTRPAPHPGEIHRFFA